MSNKNQNEKSVGSETAIAVKPSYDVAFHSENGSLNVDFEKEFENGQGFEDQTVEFLSEEFLSSVFNVKLQCVMTEIVSMDIKGETKDFVKLKIMTESGMKTLFAGQHQIKVAYDRNREKSKFDAVMAYITFKGKIKMKNNSAKTLNDFEILAKPVN